MRKEGLKKSSTNGAVEDTSIDNDADLNGSAVDADPLQGTDQPILEIPKKKGRKKNETVTEVAVPIVNNASTEDVNEDVGETTSRKRQASKDKPASASKRARAKNTTASDETNEDGDAENGDEEYEVEDIVDHKIVRGKTSFLIRWKNYDSSGDTWEPESSLSCPEIIAAYREANMKDVPQKAKKEPKPKKDKSEKEYHVSLISDEKIEDGVKYYLVRWRGYTMEDDTWEPESSLNCPELISKFQELRKNKRTNSARGTPKKLTYTEVEETEGYPSSQNTWELAASLACPDVLKVYKAKQEAELKNLAATKASKTVSKAKTPTKKPKAAPKKDTWEPENNVDSPDLVEAFMSKTGDDEDEVTVPKKKSRKA
ncbi:Chromobox protein like 3 [Pseudolycoriella hygida]|uniref:Chromobox protein like 3 n=1 Tax=Pseudolycoriella hygida TaxID=35572 RepID=A0A9Q0MN56_9DIPT|nr:Chromobox protein like 3 [Pseudolycoriella hygida]